MIQLPQFAPIPTPRPAVGPRVAPAQANQDQISIRPPQPQQQPQGGAVGGFGGLGGLGGFGGGEGGTPGREKFGNALMVIGTAMSNPGAVPGLVQSMKQERMANEQRNATMAFLQKNAPEMMEMVQAGLPAGEAFKAVLSRKQQEAADQKRSEFMARYQTDGQTAEAGGGAGITQDGFDRLWAQYENDYAQAPDDLSREVIKMKMDRLKTEVGGQFTLSPGQTRYDAQGKPIASGAPDEGDGFKQYQEVRKEIQGLPSYKNFAQAAPIYTTMVDALDRNTKASDLNLVYGLGKIFDPNSVVREGEMVLVQDTASLPDWLIGSIQSVNGGNRLQEDTRKAIIQEAKSRMDSYKSIYDTDLGQYRGLAQEYGLKEDYLIPRMPELPELSATFGGPSEGLPLPPQGAVQPQPQPPIPRVQQPQGGSGGGVADWRDWFGAQ